MAVLKTYNYYDGAYLGDYDSESEKVYAAGKELVLLGTLVPSSVESFQAWYYPPGTEPRTGPKFPLRADDGRRSKNPAAALTEALVPPPAPGDIDAPFPAGAAPGLGGSVDGADAEVRELPPYAPLPPPTPAGRLRALAELQEAKDAEYGASWRDFGAFMSALIGEVTLKGERDAGRYALLVMIAGKLHRYARNFGNGGHADSLDDLAVYAALLRSYDKGE